MAKNEKTSKQVARLLQLAARIGNGKARERNAAHQNERHTGSSKEHEADIGADLYRTGHKELRRSKLLVRLLRDSSPQECFL